MSPNYNVKRTVAIKTDSLRETGEMKNYSCLRKTFPRVGSCWIMSRSSSLSKSLNYLREGWGRGNTSGGNLLFFFLVKKKSIMLFNRKPS